VGVPPAEAAARTLRRTIDDAAAAIHKARTQNTHTSNLLFPSLISPFLLFPPSPSSLQRQVEAKVPLTAALVAEHLRLIGGAVTICYPGGLPPHDPVAEALADDEHLGGTQAGAAVVPLPGATLWGPGGKQVPPGRKLSDAVGRNEKTRALLRLQASGEGAPGREAPVSAAEQAAMLAFYRKKQEEAARLAAAEEADSDSAAWANPTSLKTSFSGVGAVRLGGRGASGFNQGVM
jgi:hypothetical protein